MKKGDVGMVKRFSKKYGNTVRAFNYLQYERDMCERQMLHPYITASRIIVNILLS